MWWRRNSQSSQKTFPTNDDVQQILSTLGKTLDNSIYVILKECVNAQAPLETQCAAIYEGIGDLLSESKLKDEHLTLIMLNTVQSLKTELEGLNFPHTESKNRENIFSGYLLRQQLKQFFSQHRDELHTLSKSTLILFTPLQNFLKEILEKEENNQEENNKEENNQLIKSMMVLIDSVVTKKDRKILKPLKFPVYTPCKSECPSTPKRSGSFEEVFAEIKMNMNDSDVVQLFERVNKLDDDISFQILKSILNCLGNQCCGEAYVPFIDLVLGSDDVKDAIGKVNEFKDALSETVRALNQQFDSIMTTISDNLNRIKINLNVVSRYSSEAKKLNDTFEELKYEKDVMAREDNGSSMRSIKQLSLERSKMETIIPKASELSESVDAVLEGVVRKVTERDKQLEIIMQMNLSTKGQKLEEFKSEIESLSRQADVGELAEQINELLAEPTHKKYLKSDEKLREMKCGDVDYDISSLQGFNANFEDVEQNVVKLKKAIEHKQELGQIIQQAELLCDQSKFILEKLKTVQQDLVLFIVNKLEQLKGKLEKYKDDSTPIKKNENYISNVWKAHEQKIETLNNSISIIRNLCGNNNPRILSTAINAYNEAIGILDSNEDNTTPSSSDKIEINRIEGQKKRFTKFWSIEIERLKKVQEYLLILNIDSEKLNNLVSQLSVLEEWLNEIKSFVDSRVDFESNQIYINAIQISKGVNQTEEHLNSMKDFLQEAAKEIKQMITDLHSEYDKKYNEIDDLQRQQTDTQTCINTQNNDLKALLCREYQTLKGQLQTGGKNLSVEDCQFLNDIAKLFTKESKLYFDEWTNYIDSGVKLAADTIAHNSEVAGIVSNFVATFIDDHTDDINKYHDLVSLYEVREQQLKELRTQLYVIDVQRKQPREILEILQRNLSDVVNFGDCESFLQNHTRTLMTITPQKGKFTSSPEKCDKTSTCSLM